MKMPMRYGAIVIALLFVTMPASIEASDDEGGCWSCQMCYQDTWFCSSCGTMTLNAISGCCGMGNGSAYCVPDYGGFAVNCASGKACQCDMIGGGCDALTIAGG